MLMKDMSRNKSFSQVRLSHIYVLYQFVAYLLTLSRITLKIFDKTGLHIRQKRRNKRKRNGILLRAGLYKLFWKDKTVLCLEAHDYGR
jgi:hypothetical protein